MRYLFKAINGLMKAIDVLGVFKMIKTDWLGHVDGFGEISMDECILDVELPNWPSMRHSERED